MREFVPTLLVVEPAPLLELFEIDSLIDVADLLMKSARFSNYSSKWRNQQCSSGVNLLNSLSQLLLSP